MSLHTDGLELINQLKWQPNLRQEDALAIPDYHQEKTPHGFSEWFYGGAAGGGKSELALQEPICKGWIQHPRWKGIIFRNTLPELKRSLIPRAHEMGFYRALGASYNATDHLWTFPSGATLRFSYLETDEQAYDHKSAEYHFAAFDELTTFTHFQYTYIGSRVRTSDRDLPAVKRGYSNPGGPGHNWVRERFVEPYRFGGKRIYDPRTNTSRIFIPAKLTDNPALMTADPNYVNRMMELPEAERRALMDGDWWAFAGQVFSEFRDIKYPGEPDYALHVIPRYPIPTFWPKIICIDWGWSHNTWVGWIAVKPDGSCVLYREYVCAKKYISQWAADIKRASQYDGNISIKIIDPSAKQQRGTPQTIYEQVVAETGWTDLEMADNDRISGRLLLHEYLRWKDRPPRFVPAEGYNPTLSAAIHRMYGTDKWLEYENMFKPEEPETNLPKLTIFEDCKNVIKTIPTCVFDPKHPEDVLKFDGDDSYDGIRYGVKAVDRLVMEAAQRAKEHGDMTQIIADYEKDRDANRLQQRLDEVRYAETIAPVSLHHSKGGRTLTNLRYRH